MSRGSPSVSTRSVVAVDGLDGSGKSQIAARLAALCKAAGTGVVTLSVDDFRRPVSFGERAGPDEEALYYERYYDFAAFDGCLRAFLDGDDAAVVPRYDSASERLEGELTFRFAGAPLAIVDGVFLRRASVVAAGETILLVVSPEEAQRRILARDRKKGRSDQEITRRITRRYFPGQERYRREHDPFGRAAVVIDNDDWRQPRLVRRRPAFPPIVERALDEVLAGPPAPLPLAG
jgi:uridine kinase